MPDLKRVLVVGDGPVKNAAALHGKDIGFIWASGDVELTIDYAQLHEGWVPITNPNPWKASGEQGWVKFSRLSELREGQDAQYLVSITPDGTPSIRRIK